MLAEERSYDGSAVSLEMVEDELRPSAISNKGRLASALANSPMSPSAPASRMSIDEGL